MSPTLWEMWINVYFMRFSDESRTRYDVYVLCRRRVRVLNFERYMAVVPLYYNDRVVKKKERDEMSGRVRYRINGVPGDCVKYILYIIYCLYTVPR